MMDVTSHSQHKQMKESKRRISLGLKGLFQMAYVIQAIVSAVNPSLRRLVKAYEINLR